MSSYTLNSKFIKYNIISNISSMLFSIDSTDNISLYLCEQIGELFNSSYTSIYKRQSIRNNCHYNFLYSELSSCKNDISSSKKKRDKNTISNHFEKPLKIADYDKVLQSGKVLLYQGDKLLLIPITLKSSLFGAICVMHLNIFDNDMKREILLCADIIRNIFNLWAENINKSYLIQSLIDFMPPTLGLNEKGEINVWNKSMEDMTNANRHDMLGKGEHENGMPFYGYRRMTVPDLILNPNNDWENKYIEYKKDADNVYSVAHCPCLPGGGAVITCKTSILYEINGYVWGAIHTVRDITRELSLENSLQVSEIMNRTITDIVKIGVATFKGDVLINHNKRFANLLGLDPILTNRNDYYSILNYVNSEDLAQTRNNFSRMFNGRDSMRFEFRFNKLDGERFYRVYSYSDVIKNTDFLNIIIDDITEQKLLAQKAKMNELKLYHEDRLTALGTMAAGVAHELNQPLNTILVTSDSLLYSLEQCTLIKQSELRKSLELISGQVDRMSQVILNIRNFSREDIELYQGNTTIQEALDNVLSMIGTQLEVHGITLHRNIVPRLLQIKGSVNRVEQVIMNLINNARQALDVSNRKDKSIWISVYPKNEYNVFEISDNATGIMPQIIYKIFDPFFTTKDVGKGTGLGLAITRSILSDIGGSIECFNNKYGGATFVASFLLSD